MVKFYISLVAAALFATTSFAQSFQSRTRAGELKSRTDKIVKAEELNKFTTQGHHYFGKLAHMNGSSSTIMRSAAGDEPITQQPEGTLFKNAYLNAKGYQVYYTSVYKDPIDGGAVDLVETDNSLYIYNMLSTFIGNTWVKGDKKKADKAGEPDTVVINLPAPFVKTTLIDSEGNDSTGMLYLMNLKYNEEKNSLTPADEQIARFTWDGDTLRSLNKYTLGVVTADGRWTGYGDDSTLIFKNKDVPTTVPANAEKIKFSLVYEKDPLTVESKIVDGAKDGDDYYIGGLVDGQDFYAKGTLKDGKIVFKKQYLGLNTETLYHTYFAPAKVKFTYLDDEEFYDLTYAEELKDGLVFNVDDKGKMATKDAYMINNGKYVLGVNVYDNCEIKKWEDKPFTPQAPQFIKVWAYEAGVGSGGFKFDEAMEDADENRLDPDKFFYQVYISPTKDDNATPYTFTTDRYEHIDADMSLVPVLFDDGGYDFQTEGTSHKVYIYEKTFDNTFVGLKAIYKGGNEIRESAITWTQLGTTGINGTEATPGEASVAYHDLCGSRVVSPVHGVYIKTVKYANGTTRNMKVIK